jgi:hypothetical protein
MSSPARVVAVKIDPNPRSTRARDDLELAAERAAQSSPPMTPERVRRISVLLGPELGAAGSATSAKPSSD